MVVGELKINGLSANCAYLCIGFKELVTMRACSFSGSTFTKNDEHKWSFSTREYNGATYQDILVTEIVKLS